MRLGVQAANLAVNGYSTDQAALRLQAALPKFADPQAVVVLFASVLLDRNLDDWRPHLDQRMEWQPPKPSWRLRQFGAALLPYRSTAEVEYGIDHTRAVLAYIVAQARQHGAQPLIVVPVFVPESPDAAQVRHRMFDGTGLPVLLVPIDTNWRLRGDGHPDARAARVIGAAVAAKLRTTNQMPGT